MKTIRKLIIVCVLALFVFVLSGCGCEHQWQEATCTAPETCKECGETQGETLPHTSSDTWETSVEPFYFAPGTEVCKCVDCGEVLDRRELPALTLVDGDHFTFKSYEYAKILSTCLEKIGVADSFTLGEVTMKKVDDNEVYALDIAIKDSEGNKISDAFVNFAALGDSYRFNYAGVALKAPKKEIPEEFYSLAEAFKMSIGADVIDSETVNHDLEYHFKYPKGNQNPHNYTYSQPEAVDNFTWGVRLISGQEHGFQKDNLSFYVSLKGDNDTKTGTPEDKKADGKKFEFNTVDVFGNKWSTESLKDYKLIMFNMWESWCGPCMREIPALELLYQKYKDQGFLLIGVTNTEPGEVIEIMAEYGINYPMLEDNDDFKPLDVGSIPATFFVDSDGNLYSHEKTYEKDTKSVYVGSKEYYDWDSIILQFLE